MSALTCTTCGLIFNDQAVMKDHYRSDWHRLNSKRKAADLPPLTWEDFQRREAAFLAASQKAPAQQKGSKGKAPVVAVKPQEAVQTTAPAVAAADATAMQASPAPVAVDGSESDSEDAEAEPTLGEAIPTLQCLFCNNLSETMEKNVQHMTKFHGLFLPDIEYLADINGLLSYLGEKVGIGRVCLVCNERGRAFRTTDAVQKHMMAKSHCRLNYDTYQHELAPYYDFTKSYAEAEASGTVVVSDKSARERLMRRSAAAAARLAAHRAAVAAGAADTAETNEEDWESDDSDSDYEDSEEEIDVDSAVTVAPSGFEIILPDGSRAGHRSLHRYYRQRPHVQDPHTTMVVNHLLVEYQARGWLTQEFRTPVEKRRLKKDQMHRDRYDVGLQLKANKLYKHIHISTADC